MCLCCSETGLLEFDADDVAHGALRIGIPENGQRGGGIPRCRIKQNRPLAQLTEAPIQGKIKLFI